VIRVADLADDATLELRVDRALVHHNALRAGLGLDPIDRDALLADLRAIAPQILPFAAPVWKVMNDARKAGKRILFEGAQGALLDIDFGTYPYVTSSNVIAGQAATGTGMGPGGIDFVLGIVKAYTTRVGEGPFPTELFDEDGDRLGTRGHEFGTTTGRKRRCGWFDACLLRQTCATSGVNGIALTKLDVLDGFETLKVCVGYDLDGQRLDYLPTAADQQARCTPIYEELPGWSESTEGARSWADLLDEAKAIVDAGAREITLLGQNVNAWDGEDDSGKLQGLDGLIRALDKIPELRRIRYMTSHPNDMTEGLIAAHGDVEKLMPFLHLPVQSGSDRILKAMNRSHSRDSYMRILDRVRAVRPDIAFSGDFIVGFPGETDADFEDTLSLVREVGHAQAYSFKYSPRPGTPAADMADQIPMEIMDERLQRLQAQIVADQTAFNDRTVGRTTDVLLERPGKFDGQLIGKSPWLQSVHVLAPDLSIGDIVTVQITDSGPLSLKGEPTMRAAA
jgi:hypothetical protein